MTNSILLVSIILVVAITGYVATKLMRLSPRHLTLGISGAIVGLLLGALLSVPLGQLPSPYGSLLPIVVTILVTLLMITVFVNQSQHAAGVASWFKALTGQRHPRGDTASGEILVDTSVIIDGRIADIAGTGFIPGRLLVPRFVLAELQNIADSDDSMRRSRGRRGLEMLNTIQATSGIQLEIIEDDIPTIKEVDAKLVALAKQRGADILTTDYNLNRVAQIEGVKVLNINELSNAIRPVVLPGEEMAVKIVQAGKERNQGVGYLPDGTMIVVENGDKMIGQEVMTEVTRVFQTVAGKMIFATPRKPGGNGNGRNGRSKSRQRPDSRTGDNLPEITRDVHSTSAIENRLIEETSQDQT